MRYALWSHTKSERHEAVHPEQHDALKCASNCIHKVRYTYPTVKEEVSVVEFLVSPGHQAADNDYVAAEFLAVIIVGSTGEYLTCPIYQLTDMGER